MQQPLQLAGIMTSMQREAHERLSNSSRL